MLFKKKKPVQMILDKQYVSEEELNKSFEKIVRKLIEDLILFGYIKEELLESESTEHFVERFVESAKEDFKYDNIFTPRMEPNKYIELPIRIGNVTVTDVHDMRVYIDTVEQMLKMRK